MGDDVASHLDGDFGVSTDLAAGLQKTLDGELETIELAACTKSAARHARTGALPGARAQPRCSSAATSHENVCSLLGGAVQRKAHGRWHNSVPCGSS